MLGMLRAVRDEATGQALSEQEVFDQCILSFQAGHETTATALVCSCPCSFFLVVVVAVGKWAEVGAVGNAKRCPRQAGRFERSENCPLVQSLMPQRFAVGAPNLSFPGA
jgi:hypothetical protein